MHLEELFNSFNSQNYLMKKIGVINTGLSNFGSIKNVLSRFGFSAEIIYKSSQLKSYSKFILPGIGKFDAAMKVLNNNSFSLHLKEYINNNDSYILGICLGMHLLCNKSSEGSLPGLALIDEEVVSLESIANAKLIYPHMGWNKVLIKKENKILSYKKDYKFYFVHSYCVQPKDKSLQLATFEYGGTFCAALQKENIYAVQFHPERSHRFGLELIENFLNL